MCLFFSQVSLFCSDDVPWYRTFKAGCMAGIACTTVLYGWMGHRAYKKECEFRNNSHIRLHNILEERSKFQEKAFLLQQQISAMGDFVVQLSRDLSYVRRLNKVLLSLERESISAKNQKKNNKNFPIMLKKKKSVSFKDTHGEKYRGR